MFDTPTLQRLLARAQERKSRQEDLSTINARLEKTERVQEKIVEMLGQILDTPKVEPIPGPQGEPGESIKGDPGDPKEILDDAVALVLKKIDKKKIVQEATQKAKNAVLQELPAPTVGGEGKPGKDAEPLDPLKVVELIKDKKLLHISHLDGYEQFVYTAKGKKKKLDMSDLRWHGGGISSITGGTNVTITETSPGHFTVSATGGATLNPQTPAGTIDGVNKDFTYTGTLNALYLNGAFQMPGTDYTTALNVISYTYPPPTGSLHFAL